MPRLEGNIAPPNDATAVVAELAAWLRERGQPYALGGAIALGYWAMPRGTLDVDLTLFLPPETPDECLCLLRELGCEVETARARSGLQENGFCQVIYRGLRVDVFLPTLPFYETAKSRRREVTLGGQQITIWDAETLAVFKMIFFRRKDVADAEQILRSGGGDFDRPWVREQLVVIHGPSDPRIAEWDALCGDVLL